MFKAEYVRQPFLRQGLVSARLLQGRAMASRVSVSPHEPELGQGLLSAGPVHRCSKHCSMTFDTGLLQQRSPLDPFIFQMVRSSGQLLAPQTATQATVTTQQCEVG